MKNTILRSGKQFAHIFLKLEMTGLKKRVSKAKSFVINKENTWNMSNPSQQNMEISLIKLLSNKLAFFMDSL
jgi:hypothetical protein